MRIETNTLDDALLALYPPLLSQAPDTRGSRGDFSEILGVTIEILQARSRLSRSETRGRLFSSLGELLWYLTGDNRLEFIEPYISRYKQESEDGVSVYGGYGPRLFQQRGHNQLGNVIKLLGDRPTSKRAVIQIFNAEDLAGSHKEIPCTTTLQFLVREERVCLVASLRSNDAFLGLPHDVFCFTMLQEIVARSLGRDIGRYIHFAGSMHLYDEHRVGAQSLVDERFQARVEMPQMPIGDPWPSIESVLKAESRIRAGELFDASIDGLDPYWADLIRILQIFFSDNDQRIKVLENAMWFPRYRPYILSRMGREMNGQTTRA